MGGVGGVEDVRWWPIVAALGEQPNDGSQFAKRRTLVAVVDVRGERGRVVGEEGELVDECEAVLAQVAEGDALPWWWVARQTRAKQRRFDQTTEEKGAQITYAWGWDWWWLKESNSDVLSVCLNTTCSWTTDDLWVGILEETLSVSCILLHQRAWRCSITRTSTSSITSTSTITSTSSITSISSISTTTWEWWWFVAACTTKTTSIWCIVSTSTSAEATAR